MLKKLICVLICASLIFLCACGDDTGEGKSLVFPIDEAPSYLDPQIVSGLSGRLIVSNCFEGLVRLDENGAVAPAAAEKWTVSPDGRTYTFSLRAGGKWYLSSAAKKFLGKDAAESFDTRVTADDFLFAFTRAVSPDTGSAYAMSLASIKNAESIIAGRADASSLGVKAKDERTLTVTLSSPDDDFLLALTTPVGMPCCRAFFEATGGRYGVGSSYLIYNGPFYISSWTAGGSASIKRNPEFVSSYTVSPASVYFSLNSEQETRLTKLLGGTYDFAPMTSEQVGQITDSDGLTVYSSENGIKAMLFNCSDELMSSYKLRKALVSSLDSSALSYGKAGGVIPGACIAGSKNYRAAAGKVKLPVYNEASAEKLFSQALGELDLSCASISVLCNTQDETAVRTAMQKWQALFGLAIDVKCESVDSETLYSRIKSGDYSIAVAEIVVNGDFACDFMTRFISTSALNTCFLKSGEYNSLMSAALRASSADALVSALKKAEQYLVDRNVIIPLDNVTRYYAAADGVSKVVLSATGELIYFSYAKKTD